MAFAAVHWLVALEAARAAGYDAGGAYWLGAVAPDAVHMREGIRTKSPEKRQSHLTSLAEEEALAALFAAGGRTPFTLGYAIHLLSDRQWVDFYPQAFPGLMKEDGHTNPAVYVPDARWMDEMLWFRWLRYTVIPEQIEAAKAHPIALPPGLTPAEYEGWGNRMMEGLASLTIPPTGQPTAMQYAQITRFIHSCGHSLKWILRE